jgi:hypothetical protein
MREFDQNRLDFCLPLGKTTLRKMPNQFLIRIAFDLLPHPLRLFLYKPRFNRSSKGCDR